MLDLPCADSDPGRWDVASLLTSEPGIINDRDLDAFRSRKLGDCCRPIASCLACVEDLDAAQTPEIQAANIRQIVDRADVVGCHRGPSIETFEEQPHLILLI